MTERKRPGKPGLKRSLLNSESVARAGWVALSLLVRAALAAVVKMVLDRLIG